MRRVLLATPHWPLAIALAACLLPALASAQTRRVEILNADFVEVTTDASGGLVRRLSGDVRLRQDTTALRADRAVYDEARGEVVLTGGVRVVSGRDTLTAAEVVYDSATRVSVARGRVRVGTPDAVLFAPEVRYDSRAEVSSFTGGGRLLHRGAVLTAPTGTYSSAARLARSDGPVTLVDSTGTLTAARGRYDTRAERADFAGTVRFARPDARLEADSLVYFRATERARAYGRVALERVGAAARASRRAPDAPPPADAPRTILFGETVLYDARAETARVRGTATRDPLVVTLRRAEGGVPDTTLARAPRIDAVRVPAPARAGTPSDTLTVLTAAGGVRLWSRRLAARADSLHLARWPARPPATGDAGRAAADTLHLRGAARPRAWADGAQLTADSLDAATLAEALMTLSARGRAFAARLDSAAGRLVQIAGGQMLGRFRDDSLRTLSVWPTAEVLAWRVDGDGRLAGAERLTADSLAIRLDGGEIREVAGIGGVAGTSFPASAPPDDARLPGFAFDPPDRPRRETLLDGWEAERLNTWDQSAPEARREAPPATPPVAPPAASLPP